MSEMIKLHSDFFGEDTGDDFEIELEQMSELAFLGKAVSIEYEAKKKREGDKREEIYRHEFETPVYVLTNGKDIVLYGKKLKVIDRGIIN